MRTSLPLLALSLVSALCVSACAPRFRPSTWTQLHVQAVDEQGKALPRARLFIDGEGRGEAPAVLWVRAGSHSFRLVSGERSGTTEQILPEGPFRLRVRIAKALPPEPAPPDLALDSIPPSEIDARMKENLGPLQGCYERVLAGMPRLKGKVVVQFEIKPDGAVGNAYVRYSNIIHDDMDHCIAATVRAIRFPPRNNEQPLRVNYPLVFEPAKR